VSEAWPTHWLDTIDSTNEEAKRRAQSGAFGPMWIAAHEQTAGRGRRGRSWTSWQGNLFSTALFVWDGHVRDLTRIPFAAALAVADTVEALVQGSKPKLKWPNDVRVDGAKLSGILVESGEVDGRRWVAAGIGLNVKEAPPAAEQATTCLAELRVGNRPESEPTIDADMALIMLETKFRIRILETQQGFQATRKAWLARADGLGQTIQVRTGETVISGVFEDMAEDGALILRLPDGEQRLIRTGDVELIRKVGS